MKKIAALLFVVSSFAFANENPPAQAHNPAAHKEVAQKAKPKAAAKKKVEAKKHTAIEPTEKKAEAVTPPSVPASPEAPAGGNS